MSSHPFRILLSEMKAQPMVRKTLKARTALRVSAALIGVGFGQTAMAQTADQPVPAREVRRHRR